MQKRIDIEYGASDYTTLRVPKAVLVGPDQHRYHREFENLPGDGRTHSRRS